MEAANSSETLVIVSTIPNGVASLLPWRWRKNVRLIRFILLLNMHGEVPRRQWGISFLCDFIRASVIFCNVGQHTLTSACCYEHLQSVLCFGWDKKFHTHTRRQVKIEFYEVREEFYNSLLILRRPLLSCKWNTYSKPTIHSQTDAHLFKLWLQFTLKLDGSYMFRSTTIIRELAIEPG
jgi:hypothetical protein